MKNKNIEANFVSLANMDSATKFPTKVAYAIVRNGRLLEPIYNDIMLCRRNILEKYGKADKTKEGYYNFETQDMANKAKQELEELGELDTEVTIHKIKFSDIEDLSLSLQEMDTLYFMLDES